MATQDTTISTVTISVIYYIPGKGWQKEKTFHSESALDKWTEKMLEKHGSDIEFRIEAR
jgi:hypothetical protein